MSRALRVVLPVVVGVQALFAVAFALQVPAAVRLWPLPYADWLSFTFVASIFAAAAASTLWCVLADEPAALAGVALDYVAISAPTALFAAGLASQRGGAGTELTVFAGACAAAALLGLLLFGWSVRLPFRDGRATPRLVRLSFAAFVVALVAAGSQLVQGSPAVLPWSVTPEAAVIYGWFFVGAAAYFAYGVARPRWATAGGPLAGFLAYDLVLLVPLLTLLPGIDGARLPSLLGYLAVVAYSGALAAYYLFVAPQTGLVASRGAGRRRFGRSAPGRRAAATSRSRPRRSGSP